MNALAVAFAGAGLAALALAGCKPEIEVGYVEIKTVPVSTNVSQPSLYLDTVKIEPVKKGVAVLRQRVGTTKLETDGSGGHLALLCDIVVKKNRITTVTVSVIERPPRCQCRNAGGGSRACVS
ncbi:MAG: hypothetical protein QOG83_791 [Alphaproteobacteria bacterium]|jgi:hypothetical protein|nr:hypothetical protein [Alphaproteobacteria bacterium]MEA2988080.1 hypothetical protein [Alphaproteobacteria bacterium]